MPVLNHPCREHETQMKNRIFGDGEGEQKDPSTFFQPFKAKDLNEDVVGPLSPTVGQIEIEYTSKEALDAAYDKFLHLGSTTAATVQELATTILWWFKHQLEHIDAGEQPCIPGQMAIIMAGLSLRKFGYRERKMSSKEEFRQGIYKIYLR